MANVYRYSNEVVSLATFIGGVIFGWFIFSGVSEMVSKAGALAIKKRIEEMEKYKRK